MSNVILLRPIKERLLKGISEFEIGETCYYKPSSNVNVEACIRSLTLTTSKVRYSLYLLESETKIDNVDSCFVVTHKNPKILELNPDN
jgi:hypothetical protein